jgi:hypothetical protein
MKNSETIDKFFDANKFLGSGFFHKQKSNHTNKTITPPNMLEEYITVYNALQNIENAKEISGVVHRINASEDIDDDSSHDDEPAPKERKLDPSGIISSILQKLVGQIIFSTEGLFRVNDSMALNLHTSSKTTSVPINNLKNHIDTVLSHCEESPFGDLKSQKTVVDKNIRLAHECKADRFELGHGFEEFLIKVKKQIESELLDDKHSIVLQPYKLNVYGQGGFFKPHVDTPVDPARMIGSLVICLPVPHQGGDLVVNHFNRQNIHEFAMDDDDDCDLIHWAAFFSDCVHEVKPVVSGNRITVTYSILEQLAQEQTYVPATKGLLQSAILDHESQQIGIVLSHKYTHAAIDSIVLKDTDKKLWDMLVDMNSVKIELLPVACRIEKYGDYYDRTISTKIYPLRQCDIDYLKSIHGNSASGVVCPEISYREVEFFYMGGGHELLGEVDAGAEFTGNEARPASSDYLYYNVAIMIDKK